MITAPLEVSHTAAAGGVGRVGGEGKEGRGKKKRKTVFAFEA